MFVIQREGEQPRIGGVYKIANHVIQITSVYAKIHFQCRHYACEEAPEYFVDTYIEDIHAEGSKAREEDALEGLPEGDYPEILLETTAVYRKLTKLLVKDRIFLFHGSVIAVDGEAYLFTAKSGTGKSTHTRLWREMFGERAVMVNDDKPLLELTEEGVTVYGTPWNGKHKLGNNISAPLKAVCVLERGETNSIVRIDPVRAYPMLLQQSNRAIEAEDMIVTLELIEQMLNKVPTYLLKCNMNPEAAKVAYEGMK